MNGAQCHNHLCNNNLCNAKYKAFPNIIGSHVTIAIANHLFSTDNDDEVFHIFQF